MHRPRRARDPAAAGGAYVVGVDVRPTTYVREQRRQLDTITNNASSKRRLSPTSKTCPENDVAAIGQRNANGEQSSRWCNCGRNDDGTAY